MAAKITKQVALIRNCPATVAEKFKRLPRWASLSGFTRTHVLTSPLQHGLSYRKILLANCVQRPLGSQSFALRNPLVTDFYKVLELSYIRDNT